jgi:hypothetical protein
MTNPVTQSDLAAALDSLILEENRLDLQPGDITVAGLKSKTGWNAHRVKRVIAEWVRDGHAEPIGKRREPQRGQLVEAWKLK